MKIKTKWYEEYRDYIIEYVDFMKAFRVTEKDAPYFTCCWCDSIPEAKSLIDESYDFNS